MLFEEVKKKQSIEQFLDIVIHSNVDVADGGREGEEVIVKGEEWLLFINHLQV